MNSTPADSKAWRSAASLAWVTGISPSTTSTRRIVATPTRDALARSSALQRSKARAARIEDLDGRWYERNTGLTVKDRQRRIRHPANKWMAATLAGLVDPDGALI